jgi:pimeloyl-ACP methyl ester carboxylesterase
MRPSPCLSPGPAGPRPSFISSPDVPPSFLRSVHWAAAPRVATRGPQRIAAALGLLVLALILPAPAAAVECPIEGNAWKFLGDLNYPDGTQVAPGMVINKGWRLQNCGTTVWNDFKAVRVSGIYGPTVMPLPNLVPGATYDLYQLMAVPTTPGRHKAEYQVRTGTDFPLESSFWVDVEVVGGGTEHTLSITRSGSGTVTSNPGGISCGSQCSASFAEGTSVSLDADPASGWVFAGWSGDGDCADGVVSMSGDRSCHASFEMDSPSNPVLSVSTSGSGSGTVSGPGIHCGAGGSDCSQSFSPGTTVTLTATPSGGSTFGGWSGDCNAGGQVVMNGDRQCTATFNGVSVCTPGLLLNVSPAGLDTADGWPSPNPVTVTMVASASGSCSGDATLRIGLPGDTPRFYPYEFGPTSGCQVSGAANFSTTSFLLNCPLSLGSGGAQTYTVKLWVQPSQGGTLDISASWKGADRNDSVSVKTAAVHPLVFVHGIQGSQPPQDALITDRESARQILDPFLGHYQPLLDQLLKMGYEWNRTLFAVAYDWRRSNDDSAVFLRDSLSGTIIPTSSALDYDAGDGRADILVHSMGGLVTRAYVQGPDYSGNLRKAIFVATPHKGFPFDYRTWEGLTWEDYVAHAPLATGGIFKFILDKIVWPSHVAKRYRPSLAELAATCWFREAVDDSLPPPYSGNVYVFSRDPRGFWVCSPQEVYRWSHSAAPGRGIESLRQMLPTEDHRDYLVAPIIGTPRPFGYEPNEWLTKLNAGISTLASRLGLDNIYTIVGNEGGTDSWYRVEPPGWAEIPPNLLWRYGKVPAFWPFVQEEPHGDTLIPLWSTGLDAGGLLSLPPDHEKVISAKGSCLPIECRGARHSPIMYLAETQQKLVPKMLAGVELPFKTDYWPPVLDLEHPVDKIWEILTLVTACPIDLHVVDPLGRQLGVDPVTGVVHREIPGAVYTEPGVEPQAVLIPNPAYGTFDITAVGYGTGVYSFRVDRTGGETATVGVFGGEIDPGDSTTVTIELPANAPPTADAGADQWLDAGDQCTAAAALDGSGFDPDGDELTFTWTGPMGTVEGPNPTVELPPGTHTLTLTVHDGRGQTASDTVVITVEDRTSPVLQVPESISAEQESLDGTPVEIAVTATDNCGVPTVSSDAPDVFPLGETVVTFTAVDPFDNMATATTTVTVVDTTPPVIENVSEPVTVEQATAAGTLVNLGMPTASDICDAAPTLIASHPASAVFPLGTTTVSYEATDASGNVAMASTTVTVVDTVPPVLSNVPAPVRVEQTSHRGTPVSLPLPTATDVCDADPDVRSDAPEAFPLGRTVVTFTATDDSGNRATATTTVTVVDTRPPVIHRVSPEPDVLWPPNHKLQSVRLQVSVDDICDTHPSCRIVSVASNEPVTGKGDHTSPDWIVTSNLTVKLRAERSGGGHGRLYWIKVRCTDDSGNSSEKTVTVTVPHDQGKDEKKPKDDEGKGKKKKKEKKGKGH